jgi:hypothetical protein
MSGALQSQGTCWLYSILNQFLLSDGMLKVLFWHMNDQYRQMPLLEKQFFDAPMNTVCPLGKNFNKVYFYKFLDQYACLQGGPGQLRKKAGMSANILKRISPGGGATYRLKGGLGGSVPTPELINAIKKLDIKPFSHNVVNAFPKSFDYYVKKAFTNPNDQFIICYRSPSLEYEIWPIKDKMWNSAYPRSVKVGSRLFDLASCTISIINDKYKGIHAAHAICGYIDMYGKGFLFDSNQMSKYFRCDWWIPAKLEKCTRKLCEIYPQFQGDGITSLGITSFIYVRRTFASMVSVSCRLRARRLNFNTRHFMHHKTLPELLNNVNKKLELGILSQAQKQKIIKNFMAKKPSPPKKHVITNFEIKNISKLTKSNIRDLISAGYTFSPATKEKIKNYFSKKAGNGTPASPINFGNKKAPSPPRKKKAPTPHVSPTEPLENTPSPPHKRRSPSVVNLRTPTPARSKPRTPSRSNLEKAKSAVAKLTTIVARKAYKRTRAVNMSQANWIELGRYINMLNWQKRKRLENARQLKKKAKN